jgi:hypothetical protein
MRVSSKSKRALLRELQHEVRRRERLARRAPRLHELIQQVETAWNHACGASPYEALDFWLIQLHSLSDAGFELTEAAHDAARRQLAAFVKQSPPALCGSSCSQATARKSP